MGIKNWWKDALGSFKNSPFEAISRISQLQPEGKRLRLAVDLSIWLNAYCLSDIDKLATTCSPVYPAPGILNNIQNIHAELSKYVTLVYVYDGIPNRLKNATRDDRKAKRDKCGKEWIDLRQRALQNINHVFTEEEIDGAIISRMKMKKPTAADHANVLKWMRQEGIECIGSLEEADLQMIKLEMDGVVDGIISEDGDEFALGAQTVYCKMNKKKNGEYEFRVLRRDVFFDESNPYDSTLNKFPEHLIDAALLLGNDYVPRIGRNGVGTVVLGSYDKSERLPCNTTDEQKQERETKTKSRKRCDDSMIHKLAASEDKEAWLVKFGTKGEKEMPPEIRSIYWKARNYMRFAPVLELSKDTGEVKIVPLNKLPGDCTDLSQLLELEWLEELSSNNTLLSDIYHCNVLPLERKPLDLYTVKSNTTDGSEPAELFEVLHFETDPINIQPTLCLVNWLRARGCNTHLFDSRESIIECVLKIQHMDKQKPQPKLQPILGTHDGFGSIKPRVANNQYDNWNTDCFTIAKRLETITDDSIDDYIGQLRCDRPSMRKRVANLVVGGFYDLRTLRCRNVETKADGIDCVLICCDCLSSKTKFMHTLYAVFEEKQSGKYLVKNSSCSCKKGEHFCSHLIGFLFIMATLQQKAASQDEMIRCYRVNASLIQGELMLIENIIARDRFKHSNAQRKRQKRSHSVA